MSVAVFVKLFNVRYDRVIKYVLLSRICFKYSVTAEDYSSIPSWAAMELSYQPSPTVAHNYQYEPKLFVL